MWEITFEKSDRKKYLYLIEYVVDCINTGKLKFGEPLPTQRQLSSKLGLSIGTITKAFNELERLGYISGEIGRGTFVKDFGLAYHDFLDLDNAGLSRFNFGHYKTPEYVGPAAQLALLSGIHEAVQAQDFFFKLNDSFTGGTISQKEAAQSWLNLVGVNTHTDNLLISYSISHATSLAVSTFTKPYETVLVENYSNPVLHDQINFVHRKPKGVAIDKEGIIPEALESICKAEKPTLLITNPTINNPCTYTSTLTRKEHIAEVLSRYKVKVVEQGHLDHFAEHNPASYFQLIPSLGIYLSSLSAGVNNAVRMGMAVASKDHIKLMDAGIRSSVWMTSHLANEIACHLINSGKATEILKVKKSLAHWRNQKLSEILRPYSIEQDPFGFHAWLRLPEHWQSKAFTEFAFQHELLVRNSELFQVEAQTDSPYIRLSLGAIFSNDIFEEGLLKLNKLIDHRP